MSSELATVKNNGSSLQVASEFDESKIRVLKDQIAPKATDAELAYFIEVCRSTGLNPVTKQIYAIHRKVKGESKMTIQTSIDGYRAIADRTGDYAGSKTVWYDQEGREHAHWVFPGAPSAAKTTV